MEKGRQHQDPEDVAVLLSVYGAEKHEIDSLTSLRGRTSEAMWWTPWARIVPDWFKTFAGLEGLADSEFTYEPTILPGLLQTQDCAAALSGSFALLGFESGLSVCYVEIADDALYLQERDQIATYSMVADNLRQVALSQERSVALIKSLISS